MSATQEPRKIIDHKRKRSQRLLMAAAVMVIAGIILLLPPVRTRIGYRLSEWRTRLTYLVNPPDEAVFVPEGPELNEAFIQTVVAETMQVLAPRTQTPTLTPAPQTTPEPTLTPTIIPTPLPEMVDLRDQVTYVHQHGRWNYCGPANLTMALKFWGWEGDRDQVAEVIKPGPIDPKMDYIDRTRVDKNVMPYEMVNFVNDTTAYKALSRYGGDLQLLKNFLANGYPVLIEKGYYEFSQITNSVDWMGHYLFVTGYNEQEGYFIVQDAYLKEGDKFIGENYQVDFDKFTEEWRFFNYIFMLVYPPEAEAEIFSLLGAWTDSEWANRHALDIANKEITELEGLGLYFAWFNKGTSHVQLFEYVDAAFAYDEAFRRYAGLEKSERPWRIVWYQTGPYFAYYYAGRYQDVINLANTTLDTVSEPTLEESFYWRGLARLALGETGNAVADLQESVRLNPNFTPGWAKLRELGVIP